MTIPDPPSGLLPCLSHDSSIHSSCNTTAPTSLAPYPPSAPPPAANKTLHFRIGQQPSQYDRYVTEYFLNQRPWQLYHSQMVPLLFAENVSDSAVEPPIVGNLPWGTTVDVIVQNAVNDTIPLYKHGDPMFLLGSKANAEWKWDTVEDALANGAERLDLQTPALQLVHDVPPLGWAVLRWQVQISGATMLHSNKFKYYAVSGSYNFRPNL